jgi:squalene-hopene/tetraprenyl-beta-curcumene cyclase
VPAVPPELVLLPDWFLQPLQNLRISRTIVVPLAIIWAAKPSCAVPDSAAISELRTGSPTANTRGRGPRRWLWGLFFNTVDRGFKALEKMRWKPLRARALRVSENWIHERLVGSDGLGAIFPPIINTIIAFRCLGFAPR